MKFLETSFYEYLQKIDEFNIHNKKQCYTNNINVNNFDKLDNLILYGSKGIGKYSQALNIIRKYSPSDLKYEKKFNILFQNKYNFNFKISDIHYEVDMSLLGCNSKLLWHDIYNHIIDIIFSKQFKKGIILCKNFHNISWDLLEIFYKYMTIEYKNINVKFIIISENIGFINDDILNICQIIPFKRPTKTTYNKIIKNKICKNIKLHEIRNIKDLKIGKKNINTHYFIFNDIYNIITNFQSLNFIELREKIYYLLTYDISIEDLLWYLIDKLYNNNYIKDKDFFNIHNKVNNFLKLYTNNYRPIFHLERILLYLCKVINEL
jgi:hypothetical protein